MLSVRNSTRSRLRVKPAMTNMVKPAMTNMVKPAMTYMVKPGSADNEE